MPHNRNLRAGDWVEVRSKEDILGSLDSAGQLEAMPFMPEMFAFVGKRFQVSKRAHKTCDPVHGNDGRRMPRAVHLEDLRCDGSAHDGCQAGCLLYWKETWLKAVDGPLSSGLIVPSDRTSPPGQNRSGACTEQDIHDSIRTRANGDAEISYVCQATRVAAATTHIPWWDIGQYVEDYASGNVRLPQMLRSLGSEVIHQLATSGLGFGSVVRMIYDTIQRARGGVPYPWRVGNVPKGARTPTAALDLVPGETVRMKEFSQVLDTLDENSRNRGLYFDPEMAVYCGGTYKVLKRIEKIIHEGSGKMLTMKNPAHILEGVVCKARYAQHRKFCPRAYYQYCREIWLERVPADSDAASAARR